MIRLLLAVVTLTVAQACGHSEDGGHAHGNHEETVPEALSLTVRVAPSAIERSGIKIEVARQEALFGGVEVPAEVQLDPDRTAHVSPIVQGQIAEVRASIGDEVAPGDTLVVLRSVALGETRAALSEAQAGLAVAEANFRRQEELQNAEIGAGRNFIEAEGALEQARARLRGLRSRARVYGQGGSGAQTVIRSPIAGQVISRHATMGEVVEPGTTLFEIADLSQVWIMGQVFAQDVEAARLAAPATLTLRSLPNRDWTGSVDYVAPALDEHTRTLPVRMVLKNKDGALRPGLFGVMRLPGAENPPEVPTVNAEAVQTIEGEFYVFVPESSEGTFRAISVRLGRSDRGRIEVLAGLSPGDRYVGAGAFVLKSEVLRSEMGAHEH